MIKNGELWGAVIAAILAIVGWLQSAAISAARLKRAQEDIRGLEGQIRNLEGKISECVPKDDLKDALGEVSVDIKDIKSSLKEMDRRRDSARREVSDFRERISGEIGEIRAVLKQRAHFMPNEKKK